jgi:hypothetical protein
VLPGLVTPPTPPSIVIALELVPPELVMPPELLMPPELVMPPKTAELVTPTEPPEFATPPELVTALDPPRSGGSAAVRDTTTCDYATRSRSSA